MLTGEQIAVVRYAFDVQGLSKAEIARTLGYSRTTVVRVLGLKGEVKRKPRQLSKVGARRKMLSKLAKETKVQNDRVLPRNPSTETLRCALARLGVKACRATVHRDMKATHDAVVRPLRPFDCAHSKEMRRKLKKRYVKTDPGVFVFSDEHYVTTNDHTTRTMWLPKAQKGKKRAQKAIPRIRKSRFNIPSIMIWAAVGKDYKSPLVFIEKRKDEDGKTLGLNAQRYVRCCLSKLVSSCSDLSERVFMQDGARCHAARHTQDYLERKGVPLLKEWPPYSPDLNPIENLWHLLDRRLSELVPRTLPELKRATLEAWEAIPMEHINALVESFQDRLKTKID